MVRKISNVFKNADLSKSLSKIDLSSFTKTLHDEEKNYADMYDLVWDAFKTDPMQLELIKEALDFVLTYRQYAKNMDWSDSSIWNLKREYLHGLWHKARRVLFTTSAWRSVRLWLHLSRYCLGVWHGS